MPRRGRHHDVGAAIGEGYRLAVALHGPDPGVLLGQHGPHPVIGLDGDHLVGAIGEEPCQGARTGTEVDDPPDTGRNDPLHRLNGRPGTVALVVRRHPAEAPRTLRFFLGMEVGQGHVERGRIEICHFPTLSGNARAHRWSKPRPDDRYPRAAVPRFLVWSG